MRRSLSLDRAGAGSALSSLQVHHPAQEAVRGARGFPGGVSVIIVCAMGISTRRKLVSLAAGVALLGIGIVTLVERIQFWSVCSGGPFVQDGLVVAAPACLDASSSTASGDFIGLWAATLALALMVVIWGIRPLGWTLMVWLVVFCPVWDPGFIWEWSLADTQPYTGVIYAIGLIVAGLAALVWSLIAARRTESNAPPSGEASATRLAAV